MAAVNRAKLEQAKASLEQRNWRKRCIYRGPSCLKARPGYDSYYSAHSRPRLVSIGPYHYGDSRLKAIQFHKYRVLHRLLQSTNKDLSTVVDAIKNLEREARACYEDLRETRFTSDVFVEMLVLDGCFILDFINFRFGVGEIEDPIYSKFHNCYELGMDLLLLENQIPLFILDKLHELLANQPHNNNNQVLDQLFEVLSPGWVIGREPASDEGEKPKLSSSQLKNVGINVLSCIEIFWYNLMYDSTTKEYTTKMAQERRIKDQGALIDLEQHAIPSVTALKEAGVVLKHRTTTPFWDIKFNAGVLEIPQIMVDIRTTESIFLNLMAFELCHLDKEMYKVNPYVVFMESLLNSASDVAELRAQGIIVAAGLSDQEVAGAFNRLGKRVFVPFNQFEGLSQGINEYCNKRRNRWRANLMHNYFNNPWTIISVIAAAFLMLLTIVQTYYTIGQYYQKS